LFWQEWLSTSGMRRSPIAALVTKMLEDLAL